MPRTDIRIVSWNQQEPVLEKRVFIIDRETGLERGAKVRGMTRKEISHIVSRWPDVDRTMATGENYCASAPVEA